MSMIGNTLMTEIINEMGISSPPEILEMLDVSIATELKQDANQSHDGMDMGLCLIETLADNKFKILFSGAKRSLYYFADGELKILKGSRRSIGGIKYTAVKPFDLDEIILKKGDCIYLDSDGLAHQNNTERKKFGRKRMLKIIEENAHRPMAEQQKILETAFLSHKAFNEQRDDITIIGIRL